MSEHRSLRGCDFKKAFGLSQKKYFNNTITIEYCVPEMNKHLGPRLKGLAMHSCVPISLKTTVSFEISQTVRGFNFPIFQLLFECSLRVLRRSCRRRPVGRSSWSGPGLDPSPEPEPCPSEINKNIIVSQTP